MYSLVFSSKHPGGPNLTAANLVVIAITVLLSLLSMATLAA